MCWQIFIVGCSNLKKTSFLKSFELLQKLQHCTASLILFLRMMHWSTSTKKNLTPTEPIHPDNSAAHRLSKPCEDALPEKKVKLFVRFLLNISSWTFLPEQGRCRGHCLPWRFPQPANNTINCSSPRWDMLVFSLESEYQMMLNSRKLGCSVYHMVWK